MTEEVDVDAFIGLGEAAVVDRAQTHYVGDDCAPDGHRSEAITAEPDPKPKRKPKADAVELPPVERLIGLVYTSASGDIPHIVTRHLYEGGVNDVICTCKASTFNLPRGCWAMVHARTILDLPPQGA